MAYVLPVRPFTFVRAFGSSEADAFNGLPVEPILSCTSTPPLSVLPPSYAVSLFEASVDR
jgi:hypothetical protein